MKRRRAIPFIFIAFVLLVAAAGNGQYLWCSTYRVENDSGPNTVRVALNLDQVRGTRPVKVMEVRRDTSKTGWLRFSGEASLRADVETPDGGRSSCSTYIESGHYHADINVDASGGAHCWVRVVSPLELGLANVIP